MPKIKILAAPQEKMAMGGTQRPPKQGPYAGQSGWALNTGQRFFDPTFSTKDPFKATNTIEEAEPGQETLEAEKGEFMTRQDPDGSLSAFDIGGKKHYAGGTKIAGQSGDFIFSDFKKLALGGPITELFGKPKDSTKKYTPADLARQYDINKYKAIIDNPDSDNLAKDTAKRQIKGFEKKLQTLALLQEAKKGFPQGMPELTGNNEKGIPQARYGGKFQQGGGNIFQPKYDQLVNKSKEYLQKMYPDSDVDIYQSSGDRNIQSQAALQKSGASHTPVSLHNVGAARDYHIYIDGKLIDNKNVDVYKNSLWKAADELGMNHLNGNPPSQDDPHPFGNTDPYHIAVVKETNNHDAYGRLLQQYPQVANTPIFKNTESYLSKQTDPKLKDYYNQIQQYKPTPKKQEGGVDPELNTQDAGYKYVPRKRIVANNTNIDGIESLPLYTTTARRKVKIVDVPQSELQPFSNEPRTQEDPTPIDISQLAATSTQNNSGINSAAGQIDTTSYNAPYGISNADRRNIFANLAVPPRQGVPIRSTPRVSIPGVVLPDERAAIAAQQSAGNAAMMANAMTGTGARVRSSNTGITGRLLEGLQQIEGQTAGEKAKILNEANRYAAEAMSKQSFATQEANQQYNQQSDTAKFNYDQSFRNYLKINAQDFGQAEKNAAKRQNLNMINAKDPFYADNNSILRWRQGYTAPDGPGSGSGAASYGEEVSRAYADLKAHNPSWSEDDLRKAAFTIVHSQKTRTRSMPYQPGKQQVTTSGSQYGFDYPTGAENNWQGMWQ